MSNAGIPDDLPGWFDQRLSPVGLCRAERSLPAEVPVGAMVWEGSYAVLLLWPLPTADEPTLAELATGRYVLDGLLAERERQAGGEQSGPIDGYLVAVLPAAPDDTLKNAIHSQELDTRICRVHVIWRGEGVWRRRERIALLAPDQSSAAVGPVSLPPALDKWALGLIDRLGADTGAAIARDVIEKAGMIS